jgi:hypothetical protein
MIVPRKFAFDTPIKKANNKMICGLVIESMYKPLTFQKNNK